ncbi:HD domain-containing protein [Mycoplasma parvum]|uniref:HD domain-containing protein n=1 Tax=Mycoplasma parvum str. Indiana TaxID=1403316 RepID=U5ND49_9MOLU|nr:HD domain-containing protein [Mycoplasma parvum]AGX89265.1 hypothetical protein PRV_02675 [Mycoplasma parvum str. Indiana]
MEKKQIEINETNSQNKDYLSKFSKKMIHLLSKYKSPKLFTGCYEEYHLAEGKFFSDKTVGQLLGKSGERKDEFFLLTGVKPHLEYSGEEPIVVLSKYNVRDIKLASLLTQKFKVSKSWSSNSIHKNFKEIEKQIISEEEEIGRETLKNIDAEINSIYLFQIVGRMANEQYSTSQTLLEHSLQISEVSAESALQLNLDSKKIKKLAFFHDIGKLFFPYYEHTSEKVFNFISELIDDSEMKEIITTHHNSLLSFTSPYISLISLINRVVTQLHFLPTNNDSLKLKEKFQIFWEKQKKEEIISSFYILSSSLHFWFIFNEEFDEMKKTLLQEEWTQELNSLLNINNNEENKNTELSGLNISFYWLPNQKYQASIYKLKMFQNEEMSKLILKT